MTGKQPARTNGPSTQMPSVTLYLGRYVYQRPRKDGTFNVLFEVPKRLRPHGWPSTTPLPILAPRHGNLSDPDEVARIIADGKTLMERLAAARAGRPAVPELKPGTLPHIIKLWGGAKLLRAIQEKVPDADEPDPDASDDWKTLAPRTRRFYRWELRPIFIWSDTLGHKPLRTMTVGNIREFLALYDDRPARKRSLRKTLSVLFDIAVEEELAPKNIVEDIRKHRRRALGGRKRPVRPWTPETVNIYCEAAREDCGWPGGAILIRGMWETAADRSDVATWTKPQHFRDGAALPAIEYDRGKTGIPTRTPISDRLAEDIRSNGAIFLVTDAAGAPYDGAANDGRLGWDLRKVKAAAIRRGAPDLLYDHLRHSAATEAFEKGMSLDKIRSLTSHASEDMLRDVYVQLSAKQTEEVQRARGLIR